MTIFVDPRCIKSVLGVSMKKHKTMKCERMKFIEFFP